MYRVLIIDDECEILEARADFLRTKGCIADSTSDTGNALIYLSKYKYDAIVLDVVMPEISGFDLCKDIKYLSDAPIIFLSSKTDLDSQITGFSSGAADYITKDCPLELFWLKLNSIIEISRKQEDSLILSFPPMEINLKNHQVTINGEIVALTSIEFNILMLLAEQPGKLHSISDLYTALWHEAYNENLESKIIQNHISRMRRKIEKAYPRHDFVETVWRKGYRFVPIDHEE